VICPTALLVFQMRTMEVHTTCESYGNPASQQQSETSRIIGDKGYEGKLGIITPMSKRKKRSRELLALEEEKDKRHELESERAAIENINERLKEWKIIGSVYRGGNQHHSFMDAVIRVVCALTNLIMRDHPIRKKK
jgi:hypothetical protein